MNDLDTTRHEFGTGLLRASVTADGAELERLSDGAGLNYLWPATPPWERHAPVLFPIVGRLRDDTLIHGGRSYPMTQHGFARDRIFTWVETSAEGCKLALANDAETYASYPFAFRFEVAYAVTAATLAISLTVTNTGADTLPVSMGAHPAFRWPLVSGVPKEAYSLMFPKDETSPMRGVAGGLLTGEKPSPIVGRRLDLKDDLFSADALVFPDPVNRSVRFAATDGPAMTVEWDGFHQLGVWSKPGADFLCIEPWCGMASPAEFVGDFEDKPWLMHIAAGEARTATYRITLTP